MHACEHDQWMSLSLSDLATYSNVRSLQGLNTELTSGILNEIQKSIRQKDEEMSWADASILQLQIRASSKNEKPESFTFQCRDPNVKKEWTVGKGCLSNNFKFCILFILNRFYN